MADPQTPNTDPAKTKESLDELGLKDLKQLNPFDKTVKQPVFSNEPPPPPPPKPVATWPKYFQDKNGKWAYWQLPNIPLIVWFLAAALSYLVPTGWPANGLSLLSFAALVYWSYLEITKGASLFRKVLGAVVLFVAVLHRVMQLIH